MHTIRDIDITGKTVLLRADYNVPLDNGVITDDYRMTQALPTLQYLLGQNCRVVIISHLGRPEGKPNPEFSLKPVAEHLQELIERPVKLAETPEAVGDAEITLLENLRFWPGEEANDSEFAKRLASLGDIFIQDGFGVVHRAHASTEAITEFLPSVAGLLLEKEIDTITQTLETPEHPLLAIVGGAKVSSKLEVLQSLIRKVDRLVVGGAMANTFFLHDQYGYPIGKSLAEEDMVDKVSGIICDIEARFGIEHPGGRVTSTEVQETINDFLLLPEQDVAVAKSIGAAQPRREVATRAVADSDIILDFGEQSTERVLTAVRTAKTIIWNGPLGMTELPAFAESSRQLAEAIAASDAFSIIGGGDTAGFIEQLGMTDRFGWVSTGGGATLDLMADKTLPGVAALQSG